MLDAVVQNRLVAFSRGVLGIILIVSIVLEMFFFPSLENFFGCIMSVVTYVTFLLVFTERHVAKFPFSFFALLPLFFYRFLPLPATLLEWKPVSYGMQLPYWTFLGETIIFVEIAAAFYLACQTGEGRNNSIRMLFRSFGLYTVPSVRYIWGLGGFGMFCYAFALFAGVSNGTGSVGNIVMSFAFLKDTPMLLFFPGLLNLRGVDTRKIIPLLYFVIQLVVTLAANSRHMIIGPMLLFAFLFVLDAVRRNVGVFSLLSPAKFLVIAVCVFGMSKLISDVSTAMLYTRSMRADVSRQELFVETYNVIKDKDLIRQLKYAEKHSKGEQTLTYANGWTEDYLDNFLLNRFCNVRITDIGLYYAAMMDESGGEVLIREYFGRVLALLPSVFIGTGGVKEYLNYSPGDRIYALAIRNESALGSRVVISDFADGIATFGVFFFLYYFVLRYAFFKLLNALSWAVGNGVIIYSPLGLILLYDIFLCQTNVNGSVGILFFCLRTFWTYLAFWVLCTFCVGFVLRSLGLRGKDVV